MSVEAPKFQAPDPEQSVLLTAEQQAAVEGAIAQSEKLTSGEIRVHVEHHCTTANVLDRAAELFYSLGMEKTEQRNGVLFYLAEKDHKFAVIGDAGINQKVPSNFWDDIKVKMQVKFRSGKFAEGLVEGILMAGKQLQQHFPKLADDKDELANTISFGS